MSKVLVDQEKCIGCGACVAIDPENFDFNEEGLSEVKNEEATEQAKEAEEACPVFAINIEGEEQANSDEMSDEEFDSEDSDEECDCEGCDCGDCGDCECGDDCDCEDSCDCDDCECDEKDED